MKKETTFTRQMNAKGFPLNLFTFLNMKKGSRLDDISRIEPTSFFIFSLVFFPHIPLVSLIGSIDETNPSCKYLGFVFLTWLGDRLREAGMRVDAVGVYRRGCPRLDVPTRALLRRALASPASHVWLFSSSEAIGHLEALEQGTREGGPAPDWRRTGARCGRSRPMSGLPRGHKPWGWGMWFWCDPRPLPWPTRSGCCQGPP